MVILVLVKVIAVIVLMTLKCLRPSETDFSHDGDYSNSDLGVGDRVDSDLGDAEIL